MKNISIQIIFFVFSMNIYSAVIAGNFSKIDGHKRTHIIMTGKAEKLGELFFLSAETKAKQLLETYPDDQIILLTTSEEKDLVYRSFFKTIDTPVSSLKESLLESVVDQLTEIASLDIYAHSNAVEGAILDKTLVAGFTLGEDAKVWEKIKPKLKANSYIMIHGCNAAVKTAPEISKKLGVAVIGALTSTDFQNVYTNGQWAFDNDSTTLNRSTDKRIRMKPDNNSYNGHWGNWSSGGFPSYKVFCGNLDSQVCGTSAINALIDFPSILKPKEILTKDDFKKNLFDFLCPTSDKKPLFENCKKHLENSLVSNEEDFYSPFLGTTLNCSFEKCDAHFKCSSLQIAINPGSCKLINDNDSKSDAFVKEFKFYMNAYDLKTNNGLHSIF